MKIGSVFSKVKGTKCIVTGGAGFIGSHITDTLLAYGAARVVVIDNLSTGNINNIKHHFENDAFTFMQADINDANSISAHFARTDFVFHQAALGSVPRSIENPPHTDINNVHGLVNILQLCRLNKVKKIVFASSSSVYGDDMSLPKVEGKTGKPLSPYAVSKVADEMYGEVFADLYDMNITGLRYFNVFGPRQNPKGPYAAVIPLFINRLLKNEQPVIYGSGEQSRDFTYVSNVVYANILAAISNHNPGFYIYNIGCGESTSVNSLFNYIKSITGATVNAKYEPERKGDILNSMASIKKAAEALDYQPLKNVEEGLEETVLWYKDKKHVFS